MNFHGFYNLEASGDILLLRLGSGTTVSYEKKDDLVILYDEKKQIIGYNLLNASNYFNKLSTGKINFTNEQIDKLNQLFRKLSLPEIRYDFNSKIVVGKVVEISNHPDSDHLHICKVDVGDELLQIVCGASNVANNILVVVAKIGAVMPNGLIIEPSKLRGIESFGMLCSAKELNIEDKKGIIILDEFTYKIGQEFM